MKERAGADALPTPTEDRFACRSIPLAVCKAQPLSVDGAQCGAYAAGMSKQPPIWITVCRLADVDPSAPGSLDAVHGALLNCVGRGTLQRMQSGGYPSLKSLEKIAHQLDVPWTELIAGHEAARKHYRLAEPTPHYGALAHPASYLQPMMPPRTLVWEDLVVKELQGQFVLAIQGDALAPHYLPGERVVWEAADFGRPGRAVLLLGPGGEFHLRLFEPRGPGRWAGVSSRPGYRELTPEIDGVRIVARSIWRSDE